MVGHVPRTPGTSRCCHSPKASSTYRKNLEQVFEEEIAFLLPHSKDFLVFFLCRAVQSSDVQHSFVVTRPALQICVSNSALLSPVCSSHTHLPPGQHPDFLITSPPSEFQGFPMTELQRVEIHYQTVGTNCLKRFTSVGARLRLSD